MDGKDTDRDTEPGYTVPKPIKCRKKQSFHVENCPGFTSLQANPDYCTACLRDVKDCNAPVVIRCGGFNSTKEAPDVCKNCKSTTGVTHGKCPSVAPLGCGAFHSLSSKPSYCINCRRTGALCLASKKEKGAYVAGCGDFQRDVHSEDEEMRKRCKHCLQHWKDCPADNGGMYPWDIPSADDDVPRLESDKARKLRGMYFHMDAESGYTGSISTDHVVDIARLFGANPTIEIARKMVKTIDINDDHTCSFHEIMSYFAGPEGQKLFSDENMGSRRESKRAYWERLFAQFNTAASGHFHIKELHRLLTYLGDTLSKVELQDYFNMLDTNQDGELSMKELVDGMMEI